MAAIETIIVGAGPAGLACAAALGAYGHSAVVLEQATNLAASWRRHYDRLHLHTPKIHSGLPGKPMPRCFPRYPSRLQFIEYLEDYAATNSLDIRYGTSVAVIRRDKTWLVESAGTAFEAKNVIVATGLAHTPVRPDWDGQQQFPGKLLHSSEFRNAAALSANRILVVGFGNSAGEIALECAERGLSVGLSVRSPVNVVPLELFGLPSATIAIAQQHFPSRLVDAINAPFVHRRFPNIETFGLEWASDGPLTTIRRGGRTPLINIGTMERIQSGDIRVFRGISTSVDRRVFFADGRNEDFDAIILATGYRPALETLIPDFAKRFHGAAAPPRGDIQPSGDGLYFCGFTAVATGLLRQIGKEARQIAGSIHHP